MRSVLFFNTDTALKTFAEKNQIDNTRFIFWDDSINTVSDEELKKHSDSEIISLFVHSEPIDTRKLDLFPHLKLIATRSTGYNHIDLSYCKNRGISVVNVPRYGEVTVAEFAFGLLLALCRKIVRANNDMARGHLMLNHYLGFDLKEKKIGIIGTGSIGRHMIQIAKGFGMNILAYDLYPSSDLNDFYVDSLDEIYQNADIISLHVPSTPENVHMLNETAFSKMKKGVLIINTARGDLIDTQALYQSLRNGTVGGAGLDVLENEDFLLHDEISVTGKTLDNAFLLDSAMNLKLLQFPNVIATPHIAFNSSDAVLRILNTTFDNIRSFINGNTKNKVS